MNLHQTKNGVILESKKGAEFSIIWLHGLGADGHDFVTLVPELGITEQFRLRFVFPHAPMRTITINNGLRMRAWYDIIDLARDALQDESGIRASQLLIEELIHAEINQGIPSENILLAGFSQGGAMALHTGLRFPKPLGGILALSTYLPLASSLEAEHTTVNNAIPILMTHGLEDPIIPIEIAQMSCQFLKALNYALEWRTYPMAHTVSSEEVIDIRRWLLARLKRDVIA